MNETIGSLTQLGPNPILMTVLLVAMSLIPFLILAMSSFLKLSVVFAILRNALGAQQIPSASITTLLALVLSLHIMAPTMNEIGQAVDSGFKGKDKQVNQLTVSDLKNVFSLSATPMESFLRKHSRLNERVYFARTNLPPTLPSTLPSTLASTETTRCVSNDATAGTCELSGENILSLVPAFVVSELRTGFSLGFALFLPFLVVELVVANILVGLGMNMVTPATVSLPFKLMLFVLSDGWFLLCKALVEGYR